MSTEMPFLDHLTELRKRLWWSLLTLVLTLVFTYWMYPGYIDFLISPLKSISEELQMLGVLEGFNARLRFSFYLALILSSPIHLANLAGFILPALTPKERRYTLWTLASGTILAISGALFAYHLILPLSLPALVSSGFIPEGTKVSLTFADNVNLLIQLLFGFAVLFQFPLILLLLMALEVVQRKTLLSQSRYVIVLIFILSAVATPPDPISQIGLALPLILLFYLSIVIAKIFKFGESYS